MEDKFFKDDGFIEVENVVEKLQDIATNDSPEDGDIVEDGKYILVRKGLFKKKLKKVKLLSQRKFNLWIGMMIAYGLIFSSFFSFFWWDSYNGVSNDILWVHVIFSLISMAIGNFIKKKSHSWGLSFLGYNFIVLPLGLTISLLLNKFFQTNVNYALLVTGIITSLITIIAIIKPNIFEKLWKSILIICIFSIVGEGIALFFGFCCNFFDMIFVILLSIHLGYSWQSAQDLDKTKDEAVKVASDIYVDIFALFLSILSAINDDDE